MRKNSLRVSLIVILLLFVIPVLSVMAGAYTFGGGISSGSPLTIDVGSTLTGIGGEDVNLVLSADAIVTALCENNGGNISPGRSPVHVTVSDSTSVPIFENGKYVFVGTELSLDVDTTDLFTVSPSPKDLGCPSDKWVVVGVSDVEYVFAYLDGFELSSGTAVALFSYVFACSDPASDGSQTCNELVSKTVY